MNAKQKYQWLLFDADGTLFDYDRAEAAALEQAFVETGIDYQPTHLSAYRHINQEVWRTFEQGGITQDALKVLRFERLLQAAGLDSGSAAATLSEVYLRCLGTRADLIDGAIDLLKACQGNYRMALLTNGLQKVQRGRLARSPIRAFIDLVVISEEIGFAKPDARFFATAFAQMGDPPKAAVLMIGDNWSSDILGATGFGLHACWFNPSRRPRPTDSPLAGEFSALRELQTWLASPK